MLDVIYLILNNLALLSCFLPVIILLQKGRGTIIQILPLSLFCFSNLIFVLLALLFALKLNNCYPVYHFSVFFCLVLILWYYYGLNFIKKVIKIALSIGFIIFIYETIYLQEFFENNFILTIYSNAIISIISFFHLFFIIIYKDKVSKDLSFQINIDIAFAFFYSSSFFVSLYENRIRENGDLLFYIIFSIFSVLVILENLILSRAIKQYNL